MLAFRSMQVLALIFLVYVLNIFKGVVMLFVLTYAVDQILDRFGYTRVTFYDLFFSYAYMTKNFDVAGYMEIDKIDHEEFRNLFVERALGKLRKLRRVMVTVMGVTMWKDIHI